MKSAKLIPTKPLRKPTKRLCLVAKIALLVESKLQAVQPRDVAQAGRIEGITPAALVLIVAWLKRQKTKERVH